MFKKLNYIRKKENLTFLFKAVKSKTIVVKCDIEGFEDQVIKDIATQSFKILILYYILFNIFIFKLGSIKKKAWRRLG